MSDTNIFLTTLGETLREWWGYIVSLMGALIMWFTLWPKLRDSVMGKLIAENRRLKALLVKMTIEETLKIDIIADLERQKKDLEIELLRQHRQQIDELHHTADPQSPPRR